MRAVLVAGGLWFFLQTTQASVAMHGLPLMRHFGAEDLPAAPSYSDIAIDAQGTLYAGSSEGVMVFRSGLWELFELPRKAAVYSLLTSSDGGIHVAGPGVLGQLRREHDGGLRFVDLLPQLAGDDPPAPYADFYSLVETGRGVYVRSGRTLLLLQRDGGTWRQTLPPGTGQQLFVVGDDLYVRIEGIGLCRVGDAAPVPLAGAQAFAHTRVSGMWAREGGLLIAASDGFYFYGGQGARKLATDADAAFAAHIPYVGIRLPDDGFAFTGYDGTLMRFSSDLRLMDSFMPGQSGVETWGLGLDREGGLWTVGESGLTRLQVPSPWTSYDRRHGLANRIFDSTWYDGRLWVAGLGIWRSEPIPAVGAPRFIQQPWQDTQLEVFAVQGSRAGLLIGDRLGLMVLDPGAPRPRRLLGPQLHGGIIKLLPSAFDPTRALALGNSTALWLEQRGGRWQVASRWDSQVGTIEGVYQTAPGEVWIGDGRGGAHRWRLDPKTGQLRERRHFGVAQGLHTDPEQGTRVLQIDRVLYAISGTRVQKLQGERFVAAELPDLPGLERSWELEATENAIGSFAWTSRQLWWRQPGKGAFQLQRVSTSRVPGFSGVELQADGRLRLVARDRLLQFDPGVAENGAPPKQARLDQVQLTRPDAPPSPLPLQPGQVQVLPPGSGLAVRFGLETMEPQVQFRYRMSAYGDSWSAWGPERELSYHRLPPGEHTLDLQARVQGGIQAAPLRYRLQVEPFWYERAGMRVLFAVAGLLVIALAMRVRNRGVNTRNRELERRIAERTTELEAANRRLTELAVVDGLTGIANRHAMERALKRGWQRCRKRGEPLALVMADVDHFKQFNDQHGHQAGDVQLQRVAAQLAIEVAGVDELAARYGGEEFVLILPGLTLEAAMSRAERVRRRVEQATAGAGLPGSISLGVAVMVPDAQSDPETLMRYADQALYRAKRAGRNRVEGPVEVDVDATSAP